MPMRCNESECLMDMTDHEVLTLPLFQELPRKSEVCSDGERIPMEPTEFLYGSNLMKQALVVRILVRYDNTLVRKQPNHTDVNETVTIIRSLDIFSTRRGSIDHQPTCRFLFQPTKCATLTIKPSTLPDVVLIVRVYWIKNGTI